MTKIRAQEDERAYPVFTRIGQGNVVLSFIDGVDGRKVMVRLFSYSVRDLTQAQVCGSCVEPRVRHIAPWIDAVPQEIEGEGPSSKLNKHSALRTSKMCRFTIGRGCLQ